jgi:prophage antirepressor-like protein/transposase-like protein
MNNNFENLIHIENGLYCLNDIAEKLILSKNVKEYIKKIKNKEWIKGNYYISKDDMKQLLSKCKTVIGQQYLNFISDIPKENNIIIEDKTDIIQDTTKHITTKENLQSKIDNRKFIDHGSNEIIYNNNRILFFEFNEILYLKAKDVCDMLKYNNARDAVNDHVDKEDILTFNIDEVKGSRKTRLPFPHSVGRGSSKSLLPLPNDNLSEYINILPIHSNTDIEQLKKIKLILEEKLKKFIDHKTIFINESGLYSLILSSHMPEAKKFKHWVTNDVLVSIRKTGSYNRVHNAPTYDELKLKELEDIPCVYLIHVKDSLYKFGRTKQSFRRMSTHKNNLEFNEIIKIFEFPNLDVAIDVENNIKKYTTSAKIRKYIEEGIEFFEVNKDYTFERVFKEINTIVNSHMSFYEKKINSGKLDVLAFIENLRIDEYNVLLNIEREKSKQAELEIKRQELELQILRLKGNSIQPPPQATPQPPPQAPPQPPPQAPPQPPPQAPPQPKAKKKYIRKIKPKTKECLDCHTLIIDKSTRCYQCVSKYKLTTAIAQSNRPTLEQLEEDLRMYTYLDVGKKYSVSDNTIRSWIKQYKKHII